MGGDLPESFLPLLDAVGAGPDEGSHLTGGVVGRPPFAFGGRSGLEFIEVLLEAEADERFLVGLAEHEVDQLDSRMTRA
jgi:hypothetical protein